MKTTTVGFAISFGVMLGAACGGSTNGSPDSGGAGNDNSPSPAATRRAGTTALRHQFVQLVQLGRDRRLRPHVRTADLRDRAGLLLHDGHRRLAGRVVRGLVS